MKILDICPLPLYPLNYGGAIYSFSKAYALVKRGHRVDFVTTKLEGSDYKLFEKIFPNNIYLSCRSRFKTFIKSVLSPYPYSFERFNITKNEERKILHKLHTEKYDIIIFEYPFSYFNRIKLLRNIARMIIFI